MSISNTSAKQCVIKKLTDREHVLLRSAMYIGSVTPESRDEYVFENGAMTFRSISYVPGLIKIINEIIDNCVDVAIKTNFEHGNQISVRVDSSSVQVQDNGTGIPVIESQDGYIPLLCWGHSRAGSNFEDDDNRTQIGMNGVGSFATNCFSSKFVGSTDDGNKYYKVVFKNNASEYTETVQDTSGKTGTTVKFWPDLARFGIQEIDDVHQNVIKQRLVNLSMSFPDISFKFNNRKINPGSFKKYVQLFGPKFETFESNDYQFAVLPNDSDDFKQLSYVNGLNIPDGGTHVDVIVNNVVRGIREKLSKRFKTIKPGDIRNKLMVVMFLKNFKNTKFNSQSKEKITNSRAEVQDYLGAVPYDKIIQRILKTPEIIDPITEVYRIKEEFRRRQELAKADKTKKRPKSEKFMPPIGPWTNIFLAEGDSAANSISKILGRDGNGFYAMFGVPPNAYSASIEDIIKSKKLTDLKDVIGMKYGKTTQDEINFKNIIITTDFDLPGHFICGQLIGLLFRFGKNLFEEGRVKRLVTPLLIAKDSKENIVQWFYSFETYQEFQSANRKMKYSYEYKKGLGSFDVDELNEVISKDGLEQMLEVFTLDDLSGESIESWLGDDTKIRKEMLDGFEFNVMAS